MMNIKMCDLDHTENIIIYRIHLSHLNVIQVSRFLFSCKLL